MTEKKKPNKNSAATKAAKFAKLRQKAIDRGITNGQATIVTNDEYVLGEDYGFSPELRVPAPSLESTLVFQQAAQQGNVWDIARSILGPDNAIRVVRVLDEQFDASAAEMVLSGIMIDVMEHFYGPGAGDVRQGFIS